MKLPFLLVFSVLAAGTPILGAAPSPAPALPALRRPAARPPGPGAAAVLATRIIPVPLAFAGTWTDTARDPFIDASKLGPNALLDRKAVAVKVVKTVGYGMKDFVADLRSAGADGAVKVDSILPGGPGRPAVAVINGDSYAEGDFIPLRVHTADFESFSALAKAKNLEFERASLPGRPTPANGGNKSATQTADVLILLQMGRIIPADTFGPGGIELRVPGYSAALVVVPVHFLPRFTPTPATAPASAQPRH